MEYTIVKAESRAALGQIVTQYMKDGWVCQGGVAMTCHMYKDRSSDDYEVWAWAQAMIRGEEQTRKTTH